LSVKGIARKVMILDDNVMDVLQVEKALKASGYTFTSLLSPRGALSKVEFERPEILLLEIATKKFKVETLIGELKASSFYHSLVVVLFSHKDPEYLQAWCVKHDLNGYYSKSMGISK